MSDAPVVIIGSGLAGLACAVHLHEAGLPVRVLEASDRAGGRVRTETVDGFLIDRGFQVYLTAYPEGRRLLDLEALDLRRFYPGALVRAEGRFHRVADPTRRPFDALGGLLSPVVRAGDVPRLLRLRQDILAGGPEVPWTARAASTLAELQARGLSERILERFFRPFLGGVLLDRRLQTSNRMFRFTFRMFAEGHAALPAGGMQRIPDQLLARLPAGTVETGVRALELDRRTPAVRRSDGETEAARHVVIATDADEAQRLAWTGGVDLTVPRWHAATTIAFAAPSSPLDEPVLVLNGEDDGPVNHLCVPSDVAPAYAGGGGALVSATVLRQPLRDDAALLPAVRAQLRAWFGSGADAWRLLRVDRIGRALPSFPPDAAAGPAAAGLRAGLAICGDHREDPSINGALRSGRRAAEAVLAAGGPAPRILPA